MNLTSSQQSAIAHTSGHLQIIACAGSGKTEVIALRVDRVTLKSLAEGLKATLKIDFDPEEFNLQTESLPFAPGKYGRAAVKVVDVFGNESTVVTELKL